MTDIWGPNLWHLMHTVAYNSNDNFSIVEKQMLSYFYKNIANMIPCIFCRSNYKQHLIEYPIDRYLENKSTLCNWVVNIHNLVNKNNNKKIYDTKEARDDHINVSINKIIMILNYFSQIAFMDRRLHSLKNLLNFFRNLQYVFPIQNGRDLLILFFKNYQIKERYVDINYFKNWYTNLIKLMRSIK